MQYNTYIQIPMDFNTGLSDKQLKIGYWYTRHRVVVRASLISFGFLVVSLVLFVNVKNILDFYIYDEIGVIQRQIVNLNVVDTIGSRNYTQPLFVGETALIQRGEAAFDFVASVTNPNRTYALEDVAFTFSVPGWTSEPIHEQFMPGERKWVLLTNVTDDFLNQYTTADPPAVRLTMAGHDWNRVKNPDAYDAFGRFNDTGLRVTSEQTSRPSPNVRDFSFDLINESVYNYRAVDIRIVLYSGNDIVAANALTVNTIRSGQTRPTSLRWFYEIPRVNRWDITIGTDMLDEDNFLPYTLDQITK